MKLSSSILIVGLYTTRMILHIVEIKKSRSAERRFREYSANIPPRVREAVK